jgi:hypothetical protein
MQRQEDHKFKASLGYKVKPCLKSLKKKKAFLKLVLISDANKKFYQKISYMWQE